MNKEIKAIQLELATGKHPPGKLADYRTQLSGFYSYYMEEYTEVLKRKPFVWRDLRVEEKTDKATDRAYDTTDDGQKEIELRGLLKSIEKMMSSISTQLRVMENELKNQW